MKALILFPIVVIVATWLTIKWIEFWLLMSPIKSYRKCIFIGLIPFFIAHVVYLVYFFQNKI